MNGDIHPARGKWCKDRVMIENNEIKRKIFIEKTIKTKYWISEIFTINVRYLECLHKKRRENINLYIQNEMDLLLLRPKPKKDKKYPEQLCAWNCELL